MAVDLEGGCRVTSMHEGNPEVEGSMKVWQQIGRATGANAISLRIYEFGPGLSPVLSNVGSDEVFYILAADKGANVIIDGHSFAIEPETGVYLRPGRSLQINNEAETAATLIGSRCPEEGNLHLKTQSAATSEPFLRLSDQKALPAADRWYRVLVDERVGSEQVTQFVGSIPPGRAPDHFHHYEEVLFILRGEGRMWAGSANTPIGPGSCVYLPKGQVHCVENTGSGELRLLGVFYPAGSPAVRYEM